MTQICKFCKKPMKFEKEYREYGYRIYKYICETEDCDNGYLKIHVCDNCEHSWKEWDLQEPIVEASSIQVELE